MKISKAFKAVLWILAASLVLGFALYLATLVQGRRIASLESRISELKEETVSLRFSVTERSAGRVSARIKLYDADGAELGSVEDSWPGQRLYLDFIIVGVGGKYLSFPYRVFTDALPASEGTDLTGVYDRAGFPAVFRSAGLSRSARRGLEALFNKVRAGEYQPKSFGNALHEVGGLSEFTVGLVYRAVARLSGGMEIMED